MSSTVTVPKIRVTKMGKPAAKSSVVTSRALEAEDEFRPFYESDALGAGMALIEPPYNPAILQSLCSENNTLGPCIEAMVTNIDQTGFLIEKKEGKTSPKDPTKKKLESWFDEVFPGLSFEALRVKVRRDLEKTGNGYIEVLRNLEGKVVFLRHIASRTFRCMRLDAPIMAEKELFRDGVSVKIPVMVRERRYAQMVGATWIYFREFGSTRHVDCVNGGWERENSPLPVNQRGTEVIHVQVNPHHYTPYGMPRWEGQIPSVLGSRRAEEFNLEFFETGGVPPALITLAGGAMTEEARKSLEMQFNAKNRSKHRVAILEVQSTSGSLDTASKVDVAVHTFGSERQSDAMFDAYDNKCHLRVRRAFRIPPLFLGEVESFNFATAFASYLVAENQVFRPEREAFDEMVNRLLMPEIGGEGYVYRSKNLSVTDIQTKLAGIQLAAATQHVDPKQIVEAINEIADLDLTPTEEPVQPPGGAPGAIPGQEGAPGAPGDGKTADGRPKPPSAGVVPGGALNPPAPKTPSIQKTDFDVLDLADQAMAALRKRDLQSIATVLRQTDSLAPIQLIKFKAAMALRSYYDPASEPEGFAELGGCSLVGMARSGEMV